MRSDHDKAAPTIERRIMQAFNRIDDLLPAGVTSAALRERLLGELFGDADRVTATLDPNFELVMHSDVGTTTTGAATVVAGVERQTAAGVLLWSEFDDLLCDGTAVAGNGMLCSLQLRERAVTTFPVAVFLRFSGDRMISEVVFIGTAVTSAVPSTDAGPSMEQLRAKLDRNPHALQPNSAP
jgi:hypothetical protein